jgi:hypothetical protein
MFHRFLLTGNGNVFYSNGSLLKKRKQIISTLIKQQQQINSKINSITGSSSGDLNINTLKVNSSSYLMGNVGIGTPADTNTGVFSNVLDVSGNVSIQGNCNISGSLVLPNKTDQFQIFSSYSYFDGQMGIGITPDTDSSYKLSVNGDALFCGNMDVRENINMKQGSGITFTDTNGVKHTQTVAANTLTRFATNIVIASSSSTPTQIDYFSKNSLYGSFLIFIEPYAYTGGVSASLYASSPSSYPSIKPYTTNNGALESCSFTLLSTNYGEFVSNITTPYYITDGTNSPYVEYSGTLGNGTYIIVNLNSIEGIVNGCYVTDDSGKVYGNITGVDIVAFQLHLDQTYNGPDVSQHFHIKTNVCQVTNYSTNNNLITFKKSDIIVQSGAVNPIVTGMIISGSGIVNGTLVNNISLSNDVYMITTSNNTTTNGSYTSTLTFRTYTTSAMNTRPFFEVGPSASSNIQLSTTIPPFNYFTVGCVNNNNFTYNMSYLQLS